MAGGRPKVASTLAIESTGASALVVGGAPGATTGAGGAKAGVYTASATPGFVGNGTGITGFTNHGVLIGAGTTGAITSSTAGTAGQLFTSNGASADPTFQTFTAPFTRLTTSASSGTHNAASATNVATCAISGLTSNDRLMVVLNISVVTANMGASLLQNSTDTVTVSDIFAGGVFTAGIGNRIVEEHTLSQDASSTTLTTATCYRNANGGAGNPGSTLATFTTAWTGSWTLALRLGAVTATGSCAWSWTVYKLAGQ